MVGMERIGVRLGRRDDVAWCEKDGECEPIKAREKRVMGSQPNQAQEDRVPAAPKLSTQQLQRVALSITYTTQQGRGLSTTFHSENATARNSEAPHPSCSTPLPRFSVFGNACDAHANRSDNIILSLCGAWGQVVANPQTPKHLHCQAETQPHRMGPGSTYGQPSSFRSPRK
eukprot:1349793-Rhodomonas_salina.3